MKSRYCYCPMTAKRIGRRVTLIEQIRRRYRQRRNKPDLYMICNCDQPVYPIKKP